MAGGEAGLPRKKHARRSGSNKGKLVAGQGDQPHRPPIQSPCSSHLGSKPPASDTASMPRCPECTSQKVWKDGLRYLNDGRTVQRYICRSCGFRFSDSTAKFKVKINIVAEPLKLSNHIPNPRNVHAVNSLSGQKRPDEVTFTLSENVRSQGPSSPHIPAARKHLNTSYPYSKDCRVCASEGEAKNLAEVQSRTEKRAAGATKPDEATARGKIVEFLWWMKKEGYKESTIISRGYRLRRLVDLGANLYDPDSVKEVIAKHDWSEARKEAMVYAYDLFAKWLGVKWERPRYKAQRKLPFIPLEREIDDLIAGCNKWIATFLQILKETGARSGEVFALKWTEVDFEGRAVRIAAEKGSNPRIFKVSPKLLSMLNWLPREGERIFSHYKTLNNLRRTFNRYRLRLSHKFGNPRLLQISFHTIRHWKGTMEYAKTKDILHVMLVLGHKNIKNTLIYTHLVKGIRDDEFICRVARAPAEIQELIEAGFEYVCERDGLTFFRKRK